MVADVEREETPFGQINLLLSLSPRLPIKTFLSIPGCFERKVFGTRKWKRETLAKKRLPSFFYRPLLRLRQSHFFRHLTRKGEDGRASLEAEKQPQQKGRRAKKRGGSESTAFLKGPAGRRHSSFFVREERRYLGGNFPLSLFRGAKKCGKECAAATSTCTNERTHRGKRELSAGGQRLRLTPLNSLFWCLGDLCDFKLPCKTKGEKNSRRKGRERKDSLRVSAAPSSRVPESSSLPFPLCQGRKSRWRHFWSFCLSAFRLLLPWGIVVDRTLAVGRRG